MALSQSGPTPLSNEESFDTSLGWRDAFYGLIVCQISMIGFQQIRNLRFLLMSWRGQARLLLISLRGQENPFAILTHEIPTFVLARSSSDSWRRGSPKGLYETILKLKLSWQ